MKSLNIYFVGPEQVELREESVRDPGPGEILIKTTRSLISTGTELICYARRVEPGSHWDRWVQYPFPPGYSQVGTVVATGEGVEGMEPGTRVVTSAPHRQYVTYAARHALIVPDAVPDEDAAWFTMASIAQNGVRRAEHVLGESIVVIGMGLLGQLVTQYCRLSGARELIAIDTSEARLEMARKHGATVTLSVPVEQAKAEVSRLTDGRLADCVYDVTGFAPVFPHALGLARTMGKVVLLGDSGTPGQQYLSSDLITRGLKVVGAHGTNPPEVATDHAWWTRPNMQRLFFTYLERRQMQVSDMVTHRFAPHDAPRAYADLLRDRSTAMGVLFEW